MHGRLCAAVRRHSGAEAAAAAGRSSEALENLNLAEKSVEREKTSDMKLQVRYGAMYIIMAQQTLNAKFLQKGITLRWKKGCRHSPFNLEAPLWYK